jgi:uncharacterized protein YwgA/O-acetyl-ADP-ribose deacetylase (regulator of RNase III)
MLTVKIGNIFDSSSKTLVNTVNCVGVMGKGIAQIFKKKYPTMFKEYKILCDNKQIKPGTLYPYYEKNEIKILNFPTKQHWRSPSNLQYIIEGLNWFIDHYEQLGIKSIAFPPLGCGNGGLTWTVVGPIMYQKLNQLPINIEIFAPYGTSKKELSIEFLSNTSKINYQEGILYEKVNKNWLLVLQLIRCLDKSKFSLKIGRTVFQKICYILERYGTSLDLNFEKGTYGPYSPDIKNMITILSNNNLIYEHEHGNCILISVTNNFTINKNDYSDKDKENVNKTYKLFQRIKDASQAELITTILYSFDQLRISNDKINEEQLYKYIINWKKRFNTPENEIKIRELIRYLASRDFIQMDYSMGINKDLFI